MKEVDPEQMYYMTRLLNFRNELAMGKVDRDNFAERLLSVMRNHPNYEKVTRVCLSIQFPFSKKLQVISSANHEKKNLMDRNYSCFVRSDTSLLDIGPGGARTFNNIDAIIDKYVEENKPVQRSLHFLSKMGFKSGLTMRLNTGSIVGYLFLNSDEVDYFRESVRRDSSYLNLLEIICESFFDKTCEDIKTLSGFKDYLERFPKDMIQSNDHLRGEGGLESLQKLYSHYIGEDVSLKVVDNTSDKSLIPWGQIVLVMSLVLKGSDHYDPKNFTVTLNEMKDHIQVKFGNPKSALEFCHITHDHYKAIRNFTKQLGMEIAQVANTYVLKVDVDHTNSGLTYSIEDPVKA